MFSSRRDDGLTNRFGFALVRRGYDRGQVDAYLERLAAGDPPADHAGFELTRRGYDRGQVDAYLSEWRRNAADGQGRSDGSGSDRP
ncbi:DivIVA domain-containing protein [Streptomyces gilvosporeus]|uniref:DivIVA domain-containing protein n=1 Tax=Streptomyces gilvosporeus TaxID=553510 RepID=A0A1V0TLX9_9ACTN|nr:DivIVA domain-containing protein [Streptomyces gilvosporeus]ARF53946.1 hypothetical protein B1H19_06890 [Streptomyces gilvosporeus]